MNRRAFRILCSLWLLTGSLLPGSGWALCVSASGHVAFEVTAAPSPPVAPVHEDVCREECPPERCEDCHDVKLASHERACPRRDACVPELALVPTSIALPGEASLVEPALAGISTEPRAHSAPHLVHVLRR